MVKLLSMDTSTKSTGCAVYKNGVLEKHALLNAEGSSELRMVEMFKKISAMIDVVKPDIIVVETPSIVRNAQTQRELTMICGSIFGKCIDNDIYFYQYRPSEWRNRVKDKGEKLPRKRAELKDWAVKRIERGYGDLVQDDVAEAILIGQAYINEFSKKEELCGM